MATTAKEFDVELVSTNVTDSTPYFANDGQIYANDEEVRIDDDIYNVYGMEDVKKYYYKDTTEEGETVNHEGLLYTANQKVEYPTIPDGLGTATSEWASPTWEELTTLDTVVVVGDYSFESKIVGTSPHTAVVTYVKLVSSGATLASTKLYYFLSDNLVAYSDLGYIDLDCVSDDADCKLIFIGGTLYHDGVSEVTHIETDVRFDLGVIPSKFLSKIRPINQLLPFDDMNTSYSTATNTMTYTIKALQSFNSFTLAGVTADSLIYTIKDSLAVVVKTDTIVLDCDLDDDGLLPQGEITKLIAAGETVEENGTIEISLTSTGEVKLGAFMTNIAIDEGATEMLIKAGFRDTNSYAEDPWGYIEEGVKPITRKFDITVIVEYSKFDKTYRRHKSFLGKFITLDGTDATLTENGLTLHSLVARGLIISVGHETLTKDNDMKPYYKYNMSFLEIV